ncbi:MAG: transposase [Pseudomonas sp.]|nr:transposase [Pseudomonas sp.]
MLTATAGVAAMANPRAFRSCREIVAWASLEPRQTGTGGEVTLQGISKQDDRYLRKLLINGAHSVIQNAKDPVPWVSELQKRRPFDVAMVFLANKMARTIWAVLADDRPYQCPWTAVSAL